MLQHKNQGGWGGSEREMQEYGGEEQLGVEAWAWTHWDHHPPLFLCRLVRGAPTVLDDDDSTTAASVLDDNNITMAAYHAGILRPVADGLSSPSCSQLM